MDNALWYQEHDRRKLLVTANDNVHHGQQHHMELLLLSLQKHNTNFKSREETKAKQLKAQQCSKNLPPQLNWFPLLYLNLAASLTIYTWYAKFIGSLFWTSFVFNPVKIMYACLIKSRIYIISKLYLCNSSIALEDDIEGRAEEIRKT